MSRPLFAGLLLATSTVLVALLASAGYQAHKTGSIPVPIVSMAAAALAAVLVLVALYVSQPAASVHTHAYCQNCGTRVFATLRSLDRRAVYTCFACGAESFVPRAAAGMLAPIRPRWPA